MFVYLNIFQDSHPVSIWPFYKDGYEYAFLNLCYPLLRQVIDLSEHVSSLIKWEYLTV